MKSPGAKCIRILLALFILAAAVAPACAGSEDCSMPCCRHKAKPVAYPADAAHPKPCCAQKTDTSAGIGPGCRFVQHPLVLTTGGDADPVIAATVVWAVLENPIMQRASTPAARCMDPSPPETPLYVRLQTLLI
jgi:hypothetical protein